MALAYSTVGSLGDSVSDANQVDVPVAGSPAAGNFLVIHVNNQRAENTWSTPSGWTAIATQRGGGGYFYKVAAGGETTVTVTKTGTVGRCQGRMMLFTTPGTASLNVSNSAASTTVSTVTPTKESTLWVFLVNTAGGAGTPSFASYAMATDNPTWTERYDDGTNGVMGMAGATSSVRTQTTATGNNTFTNSAGSNASGCVFAIGELLNAAPTASAFALTATQPASSITTTSNVPVAALPLTATTPAPTLATQQYPIFTDTTKNTATATDTTKNSATATNIPKNSASVTNTDKTG